MGIADSLSSSSLLANVTRYEDVANAPKTQNEAMGQQQFLQLFTAQLQNQNPLDPVKNEAFVAQLAQFSQLEALTNMQGSLDSFVSNMSGQQVLGSAALIGKTVAMNNAPVTYTGQAVLSGVASLPEGASGVGVQITNSQGQVVRNLIMGPQTPGDVAINWDGRDDNGTPVPQGAYRFSASAVVNESTTTVPVSTLAKVTAVLRNAVDNSVSVEVEGGTSIALTDVKRIGQ
jgi:flagellar basal-body rod modification protein FlgD